MSASLPAFSFRGSVLRFPALALVTSVIVSTAGCSGGILGSDPGTGLEVEVQLGPLNPVERPGEPNSAPVEDAIVEVRSAGGGRVRVRTDVDGRVRVVLEPGDYVVEVLDCPGALSAPAPQEATVERGFFTEVRLDCDTGIR